ncbi:MAG TPA: formyltransferase [Steroidobacteraceae bacterium]|nr:formyltransferase [Steroidobacteraceae bacterium]
MLRAIVCAYSEVGVRCLQTLLEAGVEVPLVLTHEDAPQENRWFGSVAELARRHAIEVVTPRDPNTEEWLERLAERAPQYLFSFYYRLLLGEPLLAVPAWGALNMHGSLLPKYRGRAPVNWAILKGESETGATLHYMTRKPDAGPIVAQETVPIGIDDTALSVSLAVAAAAARLLARCLPRLADGPPPGRQMDLAEGSYFGGRSPEDGRIGWQWPAARIHDLIRAVAPPFPGAFADVGAERLIFVGSHWTGESAAHPARAPCLYREGASLYLDCVDARRVRISGVAIDGERLDAEAFAQRFGRAPLRLHTVMKGMHDEEAAHPRG